jgi:hypothetical protein
MFLHRPEFFAAGLAEVANNVDCVLVDHLAQLKKRLIWLEIHIDDFLSYLLGAAEDFRRCQHAHSANLSVEFYQCGDVRFFVLERIGVAITA